MNVRINLNQARELLEFFGGEDADMTVGQCGPEAHSGAGLYVWCTEHPEEGSMKLDEQPDPDVCPQCRDAECPGCGAAPAGVPGLGDGAERRVEAKAAGLRWCHQCGEGTVAGLCRKGLPAGQCPIDAPPVTGVKTVDGGQQ